MARPHTQKGSKAEIEQRVTLVSEMICEGYTKAQIVRNCSQFYGVGKRQIEDYIAAARELIAEMAAEQHLSRNEYIRRVLAQTLRLAGKL